MRNSCRWSVLLALALLPANARAEQLTFRSDVTTAEFSATIVGELSLPRGSGPFPVVILLHPCGGLDAVVLTTLQTHSRELLSNGFATLILDSYGPRNLAGGKMCSRLVRSGLDIRYGLRRDDAFNAMATLEHHAKISKDNIFLLGLSDGASAALLSAKGAPNDRFRAIAAYYPDCGKLLGGVGYVYQSPTIVFVGERDDWTPPAECIKSKSAGVVTGAEFEVVSYPNAYHGFDQPLPLRKVMGYTMAYDREATLDSRKRYIAFFTRSLTADLKATPAFGGKAN
ncbi:MAG TPA: dienelactone hydrolase family protein [Bradyrhizobium sp.]|jgi:dienelactone hydrolase|nr:dienelactone hydrolase family protein [Bradyrhizobium sp.]